MTYELKFAENPDHPLIGQAVQVAHKQEQVSAVVQSVTGYRREDPDVLISEQELYPEYTLHHYTDTGELHIIITQDIAVISKQQLYGLITRIENLLSTESPSSVFSTAKSMMDDKIDLLERCSHLREVVKNAEL